MRYKLKRVLAGVLASLMVMSVILPYLPVSAASGAEYCFLNVGYGDTYIAYDGSKAMVIDIAESNQNKVTNYLKSKGIKELDYIILTHAHFDHMGGVAAFLATSGITVKNIVCDFANTRDKAKVDVLMDQAKSSGVNIVTASTGLTVSTGNISCQVINGRMKDQTDDNSTSVVYKVNNNGMSMITLGDLPGPLFDARVYPVVGGQMKADILKMSHHGEEQGTTSNLLSAVRPKYCVYSNTINEATSATKELVAAFGAELKTTYTGNDVHIPVGGGEVVDTPVEEKEYALENISFKSNDSSTTSSDPVTRVVREGECGYSDVKAYSINNTLTGCYYKPKLEDLPELSGIIKKTFEINSMDISRYNADLSEPYKPDGDQSRALEVLGYDFLLSNESFDLDKMKYEVTVMGANPSKSDVIMSMYKALGIERFTYYFKSVPSYNKDGDITKTRIHVFATRSSANQYLNKAQKDLKYNISNARAVMSNAEFIELVMTMMDYYGAPVYNEKEMNQLLQVYGGDIPSYLTANQQQAFLYLRSRGILTGSSMDFSSTLKYTDMLDILMRVKDEGSRVDYKEIMLTYNVGDAASANNSSNSLVYNNPLQDSGYFPKVVSFNSGEDAISVDTQYEYGDAQYYDYYVEINSATKFKSTDGSEVSTSLFVPSVPGDTSSAEMSGSQYCGMEGNYYHFKIPILSSNSDYMKATGGAYQINTRVDSDKPLYILLEAGGGVYSQFKEQGNITVGYRSSFKDGEYVDCVDKDRKSSSVKQAKANMSIGEKVLSGMRDFGNMAMGILCPNVYAAPGDVMNEALTSVKATKTYKLPEGSKATLTTTAIASAVSNNIQVSADGKSAVGTASITNAAMMDASVTTDKNKATANSLKNATDRSGSSTLAYVELQKSIIATSATGQTASTSGSGVSSTSSAPAYNQGIVSNSSNSFTTLALTNLDGVTLIKYSELVASGLFSDVSDSVKGGAYNAGDGCYQFTTRYGDVRINTTKREIVVGGVVYTINENDTTPLVVVDGDDLLVDYRVAFGWTYGMLEMNTTGTSSTTTYNIRNVSDISKGTTWVQGVNTPIINSPIGFRTGADAKNVMVLQPNTLGGDGVHYRMVLTTGNGTEDYAIHHVDMNTDPVAATSGMSANLYVYRLTETLTEDMKAQSIQAQEFMKNSYGSYVQIPASSPLRYELTDSQFAEYQNIVGRVSWVDGIGWCYTLPNKSTDGGFEKWADGTYALPYVMDGTQLYNYNVNLFDGFAYGTRPGKTGNAVSWDGSVSACDSSKNSDCDITAAPVGVPTFFGRNNDPNDSVVIREASSSKIEDWIGSVYTCAMYGSSKINSISKSQANSWQFKIDYNGVPNQSYSTIVDTGNSGFFYRTQTRYSGSASVDNSETWIMLDKHTAVSSEVSEQKVESIDAENKDKFIDFDAFSLKYTLDKIDSITTLVLYIAFTILPLVIAILLTVLLCISMISDMKIVQVVCHKVIDPVKVLTLGHMTIDNFSFKKAFFGLMLGYISCALLLNGNVLQLLEIVMSWIGVISRAIARQ